MSLPFCVFDVSIFEDYFFKFNILKIEINKVKFIIFLGKQQADGKPKLPVCLNFFNNSYGGL